MSNVGSGGASPSGTRAAPPLDPGGASALGPRGAPSLALEEPHP